jgi:hypothetical protein
VLRKIHAVDSGVRSTAPMFGLGIYLLRPLMKRAVALTLLLSPLAAGTLVHADTISAVVNSGASTVGLVGTAGSSLTLNGFPASTLLAQFGYSGTTYPTTGTVFSDSLTGTGVTMLTLSEDGTPDVSAELDNVIFQITNNTGAAISSFSALFPTAVPPPIQTYLFTGGGFFGTYTGGTFTGDVSGNAYGCSATGSCNTTGSGAFNNFLPLANVAQNTGFTYTFGGGGLAAGGSVDLYIPVDVGMLDDIGGTYVLKTDVTPVPLPGALPLLLSGFGGLGALLRRRRIALT